VRRLARAGRRVAALRHPMPYGDLERQRVQRFASSADLAAADCTIEEREEYEPYVAAGAVVYAGVDYAAILARAEQDTELLVWDGGNNDFPFLRPDLHLVLVDALRPDQLTTHHPGEAVLRMADVIVVNKVDAAPPADVERLEAAARALNPRARIVRTASPPRLDDPAAVRGKRALVVETGRPHHGAGLLASWARGGRASRSSTSLAASRSARRPRRHPHLGRVVPALTAGAAPRPAGDLDRAADAIVAGTPTWRRSSSSACGGARYESAEASEPALGAGHGSREGARRARAVKVVIAAAATRWRCRASSEREAQQAAGRRSDRRDCRGATSSSLTATALRAPPRQAARAGVPPTLGAGRGLLGYLLEQESMRCWPRRRGAPHPGRGRPRRRLCAADRRSVRC
jgi:hypothetical protein